MSEVGFLFCFIVGLIELFSKTGTDAKILVGAMIGMGLCSIAHGFFAIVDVIVRLRNK